MKNKLPYLVFELFLFVFSVTVGRIFCILGHPVLAAIWIGPASIAGCCFVAILMVE